MRSLTPRDSQNRQMRGRRWFQPNISRLGHRYATLMGALVGGLIFLAAPASALAALEAPTTEAANPVGGTSATLNGTLNPHASGTAGYYFAYAEGESCEGGTSTTPHKEATGQGIKASTPVTGLEGSTKYAFCLVATHLEEAASGLPLTFTTLASKPVTEGGAVTGNTPYSGSVNTLVNPENQSTSCVFEYGETTSYGSSVPCEPNSLEGSEAQSVSGSFTGLTPATTYHYRVLATNATGATKGVDAEFKTSPLEAPIVESQSTSGITQSSVVLEAQVNPNYQEATYEFEYATNEALTGATKVAGAAPIPNEPGGHLASVAISGLTTGVTYYYRVVATNGTGTTDGAPVASFKTQAVPAVTTGEAELVTRTSAQVSGTVNPEGDSTSAYVAYISEAGYIENGGAAATNPYSGGNVTPIVSLGSEYTPTSIGTVQLHELKPGTTYHFAVIASNSLGTRSGPDVTFTTSAATPPLVTTGEATGVTQTSATLTGTVDTRGLQTTTGFEFGATPALGSVELASTVPGTESGTTVTISASFGAYLQPGTTYYYRATAANMDGTSEGAAVKSFTTASFPALPVITSPLVALPLTPPTTTTQGTETKKTPPLTNAQKLTKALKACDKKPKSKRAACQKQARKKFPVKKKKKKKAKG